VVLWPSSLIFLESQRGLKTGYVSFVKDSFFGILIYTKTIMYEKDKQSYIFVDQISKFYWDKKNSKMSFLVCNVGIISKVHTLQTSSSNLKWVISPMRMNLFKLIKSINISKLTNWHTTLLTFQFTSSKGQHVQLHKT